MSKDESGGVSRAMIIMQLIMHLIVVLCVALIMINIVAMIIIEFSGQNNCWFRYSGSPGSESVDQYTYTRQVSLRADGNYYGGVVAAATGAVAPTNQYGQWLNAFNIRDTQMITLEPKGEVYLCEATVPSYNLETGVSTTPSPAIKIPRVGDSQYLTLTFPANSTTWRNLTQVFEGDRVLVAVAPPMIFPWGSTTPYTYTDSITNTQVTPQNSSATITGVTTVNGSTVATLSPACASTVTSDVDASCGRVAIAGSSYAGSCALTAMCVNTLQCKDTSVLTCTARDIAGTCWSWEHTDPDYTKYISACPDSSAYSGGASSDAVWGGPEYNAIVTACNSRPACPCVCNDQSSGNECDFWRCHNDLGDRYQYTSSGYNYSTFDTSSAAGHTNTTYKYSDHPICDPSDPNAVPTTPPAATAGDFFSTATAIDCNDQAVTNGYIIDIPANNVAMTGYYMPGAGYGCSGPDPSNRELPNPANSSVPASYAPSPPATPQVAWMVWGDGIITQYSDPATNSAPLAVTATQTTTSVLRESGIIAQGFPLSFNSPRVLQDVTIAPGAISNVAGTMLQYSYIQNSSNLSPSNNTGGYVLYIQHTKCQRTNGAFATDSYPSRGQIKYIIAPSGWDMNNSATFATLANDNSIQGGLNFSSGSAQVGAGSDLIAQYPEMNLWLLIDNNPDDYAGSKGAYNLSASVTTGLVVFSTSILEPLISVISANFDTLAGNIFATLTCANGDSTNCRDYFLYVRALLTLYVMFLGSMFLLGKMKMNQMTFVEHTLKIITVGGLTNSSTYNFFNSYIYGIVFGFVDDMITAISGGTDPFSFLDDLFGKILINPVTYYQLLGLISFGLNGIFALIVILTAILIFAISNLYGVATYIFAKILLAFLVSMAPFFLTLMLFEPTRHFFQTWINHIVKAIMEPVIVFTGLSIFTRMFVVYLDKTLNYSVCFKCAIPITFGSVFSSFFSVPSSIANLEILCLYWFAPWGVDPNSGAMGVSMANSICILFLGVLAFTYTGVAGGIASSLTDASGISSSGLGTQSMNQTASFAYNNASTVSAGAKALGIAGLAVSKATGVTWAANKAAQGAGWVGKRVIGVERYDKAVQSLKESPVANVLKLLSKPKKKDL